MKRNYIFLLSFFIALFLVSCSDDDPTGPDTEVIDELKAEILVDYTNNTVIKTYSSMADDAIDFYNDCVTVESAKTNASVEAAAESWRNVREHWEQSEAFLFGPANYNNLDPLLDTWPLDKNKLDQVLALPDIMEIDAAYVRDNLGSSLRGFHAVEYVLFRDGGARPVSDISEEELKYLVAVAEVLRDDCITLEASWAGEDGISQEKQSYLAEAEIEVSANYGEEMMKAGNAGSRYASVNLALEEIIQGAMDIADEVGNAKIAEPAQSQNVLDVESWYSWNSLTDFKNNIHSIENAYLGGVEGYRGTGLTEYVSSLDAELDAEILDLIDESIDKIDAIGSPFRNNLGNTTAINAAIESCTDLMNALDKINDLL